MCRIGTSGCADSGLMLKAVQSVACRWAAVVAANWFGSPCGGVACHGVASRPGGMIRAGCPRRMLAVAEEVPSGRAGVRKNEAEQACSRPPPGGREQATLAVIQKAAAGGDPIYKRSWGLVALIRLSVVLATDKNIQQRAETFLQLLRSVKQLPKRHIGVALEQFVFTNMPML